MTIVGFLASTQKAVFFCDSAGYFMKRIRRLNSYEEFEEDILHIRQDETPKFKPIGKHAVVFQLDTHLNPESLHLENGEEQPHKIAEALGKYAVDHLDIRHAHLYSPFTAYVIAFGKISLASNEERKGIIGYILDVGMNMKNPYMKNNMMFKPSHLGIPAFYIGVTTWEAREVLHDLVFPYFKNMGKNGLTYDDCMNNAIKKFLKNCKQAFDYIARKWPLFIPPFRVAKLDHNGFRWIQNAPVEIKLKRGVYESNFRAKRKEVKK